MLQQYTDEKKKLYNILMTYLIQNGCFDKEFQSLINIIKQQEITSLKEEFRSFLQLLLNLWKNHHRTVDFIGKIKKILFYFTDQIKQTFSNSEIFNIFISDKSILLFLFENSFITIDESIAKRLLVETEPNGVMYCHFFIPEIKKFIEEEKNEEIASKFSEIKVVDIDNYEEKRHEGQNDSYFAALIRNDMVREFSIYINKTNLRASSKIEPSIFETNSFLNEVDTTIIEYAAFFGSLKIFNYLKMLNDAILNPCIWLFAIHSNKPKMIHTLEGCNVELDSMKCFEEAIKCHHNEIANYFEIINTFDKDEQIYEAAISTIFESCNYLYIGPALKSNSVFIYSYIYDYHEIVNMHIQQVANVIEPNDNIQKTNFKLFMM